MTEPTTTAHPTDDERRAFSCLFNSWLRSEIQLHQDAKRAVALADDSPWLKSKIEEFRKAVALEQAKGADLKDQIKVACRIGAVVYTEASGIGTEQPETKLE